MKGGDISNEQAPRIVFTWEHLLFRIPIKSEKLEAKYIRRGSYRKALDLWEEERVVRRLLHDTAWRRSIPVDILVIEHPQGFVDLLRDRLDSNNYPCNRLYCSSPQEFSQELAFMPEITAVYHADPRAPFLYGSKGKFMPDLARPSL